MKSINRMNALAAKALTCALAGSVLALAAPSAFGHGRAADIVNYKGVQYDGECLYKLAKRNPGISDADYEPLMEQCLWNGVENPPAPGIPIKTLSSIDCTTILCVIGDGRAPRPR